MRRAGLSRAAAQENIFLVVTCWSIAGASSLRRPQIWGLGHLTILRWPEWPPIVAFPSLGGLPHRSPLTPQSRDDIAPSIANTRYQHHLHVIFFWPPDVKELLCENSGGWSYSKAATFHLGRAVTGAALINVCIFCSPSAHLLYVRFQLHKLQQS